MQYVSEFTLPSEMSERSGTGGWLELFGESLAIAEKEEM